MAKKGEKRKKPTFSKLINFGPHILAFLENTRPVLHDRRNLWAKVQKRLRYGEKRGKKQKTPIFSKLINFDSHILTILESPWPGLYDPKSSWAKV